MPAKSVPVNCRSLGNDQIGVDFAPRCRSEELSNHVLHDRHASGTADQHDVFEVSRSKASFFRNIEAEVKALGDHRPRQSLEFVARHRKFECAERSSVERNKLLQLARAFGRVGQRTLQPLRSRANTFKRLRILAWVVLVRVLAGIAHSLGQEEVDVISAEEGVPARRKNFEDIVFEFEQREVECAAAQIVDRDTLCFLFPVTVRERSGGWFVDDPCDVEPGDSPRGLGRASLELVEVRWNGDDGSSYRLPDTLFRGPANIAEYKSADLCQRVGLAMCFGDDATVRTLDQLERESLLCSAHLGAAVRSPDEPLHAVNRIWGIDETSVSGVLSDQNFPVRRK